MAPSTQTQLLETNNIILNYNPPIKFQEQEESNLNEIGHELYDITRIQQEMVQQEQRLTPEEVIYDQNNLLTEDKNEILFTLNHSMSNMSLTLLQDL